jgi:cysteine desulfurase
MIYLDYNASTPLDPAVVDAMRPYQAEQFGNPSSVHALGTEAKKAIEKARCQVAAMINAQPDEIIFTSGGTESNNFAIKGIAFGNRSRGNHIITSAVEHPSVAEVCRFLESQGFTITYLPVDEAGSVILSELQKSISSSTILITIMHANNETGSIQPIREIGEIARMHGISFHTDAAQSCGKIPVDVMKMNADLLTIAGHKLYAPKGIGALYIRRGIHLEKLIHGADHEQNLRAGTENVASIVGLGMAAELAKRYISRKETEILDTEALTGQLLNSLTSLLPEIRLNGSLTNRLPNTLSIGFPGVHANLLLDRMEGIAASAGAACHAGDASKSTVLGAMHVPPDYSMGTIRFSLGRTTTLAEIEKAVPLIVEAYRSLKTDVHIPETASGNAEIKLTHYTHGLGCACKIRPQVLEQILRNLPQIDNPNVIVGFGTSDDAAVYKLNEKEALVQTVDFIPPIVDDPYHYGAVAAANAISDIYAMGGTPLFALSIVGFPLNLLPLDVLHRILKGAADKATEAGIPILGGHTIEDAEPKFGLVVTGMVSRDKVLTNANARSGDAIILTKPIGAGILSTGLKRGMVNENDKDALIHMMEQLNKPSAEVMERFPVHACTDVTGFGLLGHLKEMVSGSGVGASIGFSNVPVLPGVWDLAAARVIPGGTVTNLQSVEAFTRWSTEIPETGKMILADAQTSGGLLIALPAQYAKEIVDALHNAGVKEASLIGHFTGGESVIRIQPEIIF